MERTCRARTLARGAAGSIDQCTDCGVISLHVGPTTLRIDHATAEALFAQLGEALQLLHPERGRVGPARALGQA